MKRFFTFFVFEIICCTYFVGDLCYEMIQIFHIPIVCEFRFFNKSWSLLNSPSINKNLLFEFIVVLYYFFWFFHMYIVCCRLVPWKKDFTSVSLLPFTKRLCRSSYSITMTHCDVILILFLFRFVANVQELAWDIFLVLTMNKRDVIRIYLLRARMTPPTQAYTGLK